MDLTYLLLSLCCVAFTAGQQRVAPGVPPQQYTQQVGQQPMHQVPVQQQHVQYQQVPVQQQVPIQQVQQQIPVQQVPVQQVPVQHVPVQQVPVQQHVPVQQQQHVPVQQQQHIPQHHKQQILNAANIAHEKEHIQEHLEVPIDTSKMSEQELQFHYFKMHDADNNNKLDGCELIKSLIHWHDPGENDAGKEGTLFESDRQIEEIIDPILKEADLNNDGFIEYTEFKLADSTKM